MGERFDVEKITLGTRSRPINMKILHINTERTWRGGEQQTLYLLKGLTNRNIRADLVAQPHSPMAERAIEAGINVFATTMRSEIGFWAGSRIRRLIKQSNYDIIHSHTSHAHALAFWASMGCGIRRLVTRRVDFSIFRHSFLHLSGIKYRRMADYYIAISRKIKDVLINDGLAPERIFVVHSGIDPDRFRHLSGNHLIKEFNLQPHEKMVINVAHLAGHKGQQFFVRAIPQVLEKNRDVRFFIVGGGELSAELQALSTALGIGHKLIFTGFREDVGAFYKLADLFVMSSVQEGLGTAVLDALAMGIPVVAANSGGLPEIISDGHTGRLVEPANPNALADGIIQLLTNTDLAKRMASRGRELVRNNFCIDTMVANNIEVYRTVLNRAG